VVVVVVIIVAVVVGVVVTVIIMITLNEFKAVTCMERSRNA
jgi:hypothetical protein